MCSGRSKPVGDPIAISAFGSGQYEWTQDLSLCLIDPTAWVSPDLGVLDRAREELTAAVNQLAGRIISSRSLPITIVRLRIARRELLKANKANKLSIARFHLPAWLPTVPRATRTVCIRHWRFRPDAILFMTDGGSPKVKWWATASDPLDGG